MLTQDGNNKVTITDSDLARLPSKSYSLDVDYVSVPPEGHILYVDDAAISSLDVMLDEFRFGRYLWEINGVKYHYSGAERKPTGLVVYFLEKDIPSNITSVTVYDLFRSGRFPSNWSSNAGDITNIESSNPDSVTLTTEDRFLSGIEYYFEYIGEDPDMYFYDQEIIVSQDGKGQFTDLKDALEYLDTLSPTGRYGIILYPGDYYINESIEFNNNTSGFYIRSKVPYQAKIIIPDTYSGEDGVFINNTGSDISLFGLGFLEIESNCTRPLVFSFINSDLTTFPSISSIFMHDLNISIASGASLISYFYSNGIIRFYNIKSSGTFDITSFSDNQIIVRDIDVNNITLRASNPSPSLSVSVRDVKTYGSAKIINAYTVFVYGLEANYLSISSSTLDTVSSKISNVKIGSNGMILTTPNTDLYIQGLDFTTNTAGLTITDTKLHVKNALMGSVTPTLIGSATFTNEDGSSGGGSGGINSTLNRIVKTVDMGGASSYTYTVAISDIEEIIEFVNGASGINTITVDFSKPGDGTRKHIELVNRSATDYYAQFRISYDGGSAADLVKLMSDTSIVMTVDPDNEDYVIHQSSNPGWDLGNVGLVMDGESSILHGNANLVMNHITLTDHIFDTGGFVANNNVYNVIGGAYTAGNDFHANVFIGSNITGQDSWGSTNNVVLGSDVLLTDDTYTAKSVVIGSSLNMQDYRWLDQSVALGYNIELDTTSSVTATDSVFIGPDIKVSSGAISSSILIGDNNKVNAASAITRDIIMGYSSYWGDPANTGTNSGASVGQVVIGNSNNIASTNDGHTYNYNVYIGNFIVDRPGVDYVSVYNTSVVGNYIHIENQVASSSSYANTIHLTGDSTASNSYLYLGSSTYNTIMGSKFSGDSSAIIENQNTIIGNNVNIQRTINNNIALLNYHEFRNGDDHDHLNIVANATTDYVYDLLPPYLEDAYIVINKHHLKMDVSVPLNDTGSEIVSLLGSTVSNEWHRSFVSLPVGNDFINENYTLQVNGHLRVFLPVLDPASEGHSYVAWSGYIALKSYKDSSSNLLNHLYVMPDDGRSFGSGDIYYYLRTVYDSSGYFSGSSTSGDIGNLYFLHEDGTETGVSYLSIVYPDDISSDNWSSHTRSFGIWFYSKEFNFTSLVADNTDDMRPLRIEWQAITDR